MKYIPFLFTLLWSTGFIGAKFGLPYIEPYSFLAVRFILTLMILGLLIFLFRPKFPRVKIDYFHVFITGILIHVAYLGGVFSAIKLGLPAGVTAVIVGMQPLLTTLIFHRFKSPMILVASALGFLGLLLVVADDLTFMDGDKWQVYIPSLIALLGISLGTIYQKKYCTHIDIMTIAFLQYIPTVIIFILLAGLFEDQQQIEWHLELMLAMMWLVIVLSIGAIMLMSLLYRHNSASSAANYFYLTPPLALIQGYLFFDEKISVVNLAGILLVVVSLFLTSKLLANIDK